MATLKQRLLKKNSSGTYDTLHLETSASIVLMNNGVTVENAVNGKAASTHTHAATDIASGTLGLARGGTAGTTGPTALWNVVNPCTALSNTGLADTDVIPIGDVSASTGKKVTIANLRTYFGLAASSGSVATPPAASSVTVGGTVSFASYDWICVHEDTQSKYMMTKCILEMTQWGATTNAVPIYANSYVAAMCKVFAENLGLDKSGAFNQLATGTVISYCTLASYDQVNGGFTYFNSNARRIAYDLKGTAQYWWTCTPYGTVSAYYVISDGYVSNGGISVTNSYGFRPLVALKK